MLKESKDTNRFLVTGWSFTGLDLECLWSYLYPYWFLCFTCFSNWVARLTLRDFCITEKFWGIVFPFPFTLKMHRAFHLISFSSFCIVSCNASVARPWLLTKWCTDISHTSSLTYDKQWNEVTRWSISFFMANSKQERAAAANIPHRHSLACRYTPYSMLILNRPMAMFNNQKIKNNLGSMGVQISGSVSQNMFSSEVKNFAQGFCPLGIENL